MKPVIFCLFWLFAALASYAQMRSDPPPQLIPARTIAVPFSAAEAGRQMNGWQLRAAEAPQNAENWLNYALWTQRNPQLTPQKKLQQLNQIAANAASYIASAGEWQLIRFLQSDKQDSTAIETALQQMADKRTVYPFAIQSAIIRQNAADLKRYCAAFAALTAAEADLSFSAYHTNVLLSAPDSAIIAARGENDLVPMAVLQQVNGVRPDLRLVYYEPSVTERYKNVFLCLSLGEDVLNRYRQTASFRALLLQVSANASAIKPEDLFPELTKMNYMRSGAFTGTLAQLHNNYLPSLLLAWRYYRGTDAAKAEHYKQLIEKIAREGGKEETIKPLLQQ